MKLLVTNVQSVVIPGTGHWVQWERAELFTRVATDFRSGPRFSAPFTSAIWHENVFATQFHPEKSQRVGLAILHEFATHR